jgi:predicted dehydrogenase
VDGTGGSVCASLTGVDFFSKGSARRVDVKGAWVPDGFLGALRSFLRHLDDGAPLPHSGADHLRSLAVATAAARSGALDGQWVDVPAGSLLES